MLSHRTRNAGRRWCRKAAREPFQIRGQASKAAKPRRSRRQPKPRNNYLYVPTSSSNQKAGHERREILATRWFRASVNTVMQAATRALPSGSSMAPLIRSREKNPGSNPLEVLQRAVRQREAPARVKARRVGGAFTYQVPDGSHHDRQFVLALRWLVDFDGCARKGMPMRRKPWRLKSWTLIKGRGTPFRKRDEMHKMAQANKAFAHFCQVVYNSILPAPPPTSRSGRFQVR